MSSSSSVVTDQNIISSWNRGPIETIFVHPASCTATLTFVARSNGNTGDLYFGHHGTPVSAECYPTGTPSAPPLNDDSAWRGYYYSPALCPSGWTTATRFLSSVPYFPTPNFFVLGSETTAALCCPAGFTYLGDGCQCKSTITAGQIITIVSQSFDGQKQSWMRGNAITQSQLTVTVVSGDGVPIMWQSKDAEVLGRASTMTPTTQTSSASMTTALGTTTPTNLPGTTGISSPGGLSIGTKIGVGVGVPIAVIAGLAMGVLLWKRRRTQQTKPESSTVYEQHGFSANDKDVYAAPTPAYHGAEPIHELQSRPEAYHARHELPAVAHQ